MAKATTAKAPKKVKKSTRLAVKAAAKPKSDGKRKGGQSKARDAADALWKLAEHPLVSELLAIGATAAVAAIAEGSGKGKKKASSKAVKAAGKAAAAAIGARLISEFAEGSAKKAKPAKG
ncbi:MAG: hypothetical protein M3Q19_07605 [Pseudomonadota bacterium]|nr:hypothetical protein [Pseudomonadota bacterium]